MYEGPSHTRYVLNCTGGRPCCERSNSMDCLYFLLMQENSDEARSGSSYVNTVLGDGCPSSAMDG